MKKENKNHQITVDDKYTMYSAIFIIFTFHFNSFELADVFGNSVVVQGLKAG